MRNWLKAYREKKNISQQQLATLVDIDITAIGKYENGKRRPSVDTAKKIAEVLDFDWTRFYEEDD